MRVWISLLLVACSAALHGQDGSENTPLFRSAASDLVVLSASVTDKEGGFVEGLESERFTVYDNGKPRPIVLFSNEDIPVSVGLIIDSSSSMRRRIGEIVAAAVAFARSSHPEDELFALAFNDTVQEALTDRRFLLASDLAALEDAVSSLTPEGRTSLYDAIMAGLDRLDAASRARKVLIVMSDGGDNASRATRDQVLARARQSSATIYTIGLFDPADPDSNPGVLKSLAQASGGERFLPGSPSQLLQACQRIAQDVRSGYTIAFEPSRRDGTYHRVEVKVGKVDPADRRRLDVRTRLGYFAPAASPGVNP